MEDKEEKKLKDKIEKDVYGSFHLGGIEFALSVKAIQEVTNEPESYDPMPLAPSYLKGLFNLRGLIIPVVDLRTVFDIKDECGDNQYEKKIAIIEYGEHCVGLLFDKTGDVFNGNDEEKCEFHHKSGDIKDLVVKGVFKMGDGKRIIQILDPHEVLNLEQIPRTKDSSSARNKKIGIKKQCISFLVGTAVCAIGIDAIQEIIDLNEVQNSALSGEFCLGAVDIRGKTIPIIDFSNILGYGKVDDTYLEESHKVLIMKVDNESFGLLVKSVENILSYFDEDLITFPTLGDNKKEIFAGCISPNEKILAILLNHKEVLSNAEITSITKGHSNLYKEHVDNFAETKKDELSKKTYITFMVENCHALEISEVVEVINYPDDVIQPPNLSKNLKGMFNLRGKIVAVIDPRQLYEMPKLATNHKAKMIIFNEQKTTFGLVVDSVDSIISFTEKDKIKLPEMLYHGSENSLNENVREAIQVDAKDNIKKTLIILNLASLVSKVYNDTTKVA
jgi:purine-binding chemotaxis protein CheW